MGCLGPSSIFIFLNELWYIHYTIGDYKSGSVSVHSFGGSFTIRKNKVNQV